MAPGADARWVARLRPAPHMSVGELLDMPLGLDVWERRDSDIVVAATDAQLSEIERRRLATVERLSTVQQLRDRPEQ